MATNWFQSVFGFTECESYSKNKAHFDVIVPPEGGEGESVLVSKANGQSFVIGAFSIPTVAELRQQLKDLAAVNTNVTNGMTFSHVHGDVRSMIRDPKSEGNVFQVASQFNCLEMVGPGVSPDRGISIYAHDPTQGPACALACPAATAFRNYIAPDGKGQGGAGERNQINTMRAVETLLDNSRRHFWTMSNGYLLPSSTSSMSKLSELLQSRESELARSLVASVAAGVHWGTEVNTASKHRVAQVFASAVPVAYAKSTKSEDWALLASLVLEAAFEAAILVGAVLARKQGRRVSVFLTSVGGGAFGNRIEWIVDAIQLALVNYASEPIDVKLVHYGQVVPALMKRLSVPSQQKNRE